MTHDECFQLFWKNYPRKENRFYAQKCFNKIEINEDVIKSIIVWLGEAKQSQQWQNKNYIPMPSTFLNQHRWESDPPPPVDDWKNSITIED